MKKIILSENIVDQLKQYKKWKSQNVTYRGISGELHDQGQGGMAVLGQGLYTVPQSNKSMAKGYGTVYFVLNAIPKKPKTFSTMNDAQVWIQQNIYKNDSRTFYKEEKTIAEEMIKLGYDGIIIKGREMVHYKPEDVKYFENERQLIQYYEYFVENNDN